MKFPAHKGSMQIAHNDHKSSYQTAEDWILSHESSTESQYFDWISPEERQKAIDTDSMWTLQWYPDTPVGFCCVAASTFDALMEYFKDE